MRIDTTEKENTEKRNTFYKVICELKKVDPRYGVYRNNEYFDTHRFLLMGYHWWERLLGFNDKIASIDFDQSALNRHIVYIRVKMEGYINFAQRIGHFFEDEGFEVTIVDHTLKAKETC